MTRCRCVCWLCGLLALIVFALAAHGQSTPPTTAPATTAPAAPAAANWVDFTGTSGYRLRFPDSMRRMEIDQPGVDLVLIRPKADPGGTQAQILVVAPPDLKTGPDLAQTATAYVENFKRAMTDPKVLEQTDATLGGDPAKVYLIEGHQVQGGRETRAKLVVAVHDGRLYTLAAMAEPAGFDTLAELFDTMVESFQWTK